MEAHFIVPKRSGSNDSTVYPMVVSSQRAVSIIYNDVVSDKTAIDGGEFE